LEVRIARQLLDQAKAEGVSLVDLGGLLAGVTRTVLQAITAAHEILTVPPLENAPAW
jgi:hypothetical protein